jgi:DNA-binding MarR family transcriptional regulator
VNRTPALELSDAVGVFMRYFLAHVNPVLHRVTFRGRRYRENQVICLMALGVCGRLTPGEISHAIDVHKGSLTLILRGLCEDGLAKQLPDGKDRRRYSLELTPRGQRFVQLTVRQREDGFRGLFGDMAPADALAAARGLRLIADHLRRLEASRALRRVEKGS